MIKRSKFVWFALSISILASPCAIACSFAPGFLLFKLSSRVAPYSGEAPELPNVQFKSIQRGFDDGNGASCSDAGILTFVVSPEAMDKNVGYLFKRTSGSFPDAVLPNEIVSPIELDDGQFGFYFVWLDSAAPINVQIEVRAVSKSGVESDALKLRVESG